MHEHSIHRKHLRNAHFYTYAEQYSLPIHLTFWIIFFLALVLLDTNDLPFRTNIISNLSMTLFFAGIVYANILYLIPKYLFAQKTLLYILFLLLGIVLITPIYISMRSEERRVGEVCVCVGL